MSALDELRSTVNDLHHQDMPLQTLRANLNELLDDVSGSQQMDSFVFTLNRAGGFVAEHIFDLGADGPHPIQVTMTMLSFIADGEVLGNDPGTIYVGGGDSPVASTNSDNSNHFQIVAFKEVNHYVVSAGGFVFELQGDDIPVSAIGMAARYLKIIPQLVSNDGGATYAGANNPVASVQVDVIHL